MKIKIAVTACALIWMCAGQSSEPAASSPPGQLNEPGDRSTKSNGTLVKPDEAVRGVSGTSGVTGVESSSGAVDRQSNTDLVEVGAPVDPGDLSEDGGESQGVGASCPAGCSCVGGLEPEYYCMVAGGGELSVRVRPGRELRVRCDPPAQLPASPPRLPLFAPTPRASFEGCAPHAALWEPALRAFGAGSVSSLRVGSPPADMRAAPAAADLPALTSLELVQALPAGDVVRAPGLRSLRRLVMRGGPLRLAADSLSPAPGLLWLEVAEAQLPEVPAHAFRGLGSLRRLGLWHNNISRLAAGALAGLDALEELDLSSNPLREVSAGALSDAPNLTVLVLRSAVPARLEAAALSGLTRLRELTVTDAAHGARTQLGAGALSGLPGLRSARLERCGLATLPGDLLLGSAGLLNLSLSGNVLETLPGEVFRDQRELRVLDLSYNRLTTLHPALFQSLTELMELNLDNNRLKSLSNSVLSPLHSLEVLSVQHNGLEVCADDAGAEDGQQYLQFGARSPFSGLVRLRRLRMAENAARALCGDWRVTMVLLEHLELRHNQLTQLTDADLNFLSANIEVDLRDNNISTVMLSPPLSPDVVGAGGAESTARLLLDGNPLNCDCRLQAAADRARRGPGPGEARLVGPQCAAPPRLAGRPLSALGPRDLSCELPGPLCPPHCSCWLVPGVGELQLQCERSPAVETWPAPITLGLQKSSLRLLRPPVSLANLTLPPHVRTLSLRALNLSALEGEAPATLAVLDLRDNLLPAVPRALLQHNGTRLLVAGNPLACDCQHADDIALLVEMKNQVSDWAAAAPACAGLEAGSLCAARRTLVLALCGAALALAAAVALVSAWRRRARNWLRARGLWPAARDPRDEQPARYDAFVSYSHHDEAWVATELLPALEGGASPRRLCVHHRDWPAGEWIPAQIARSVAESRRTLLVLSPQYVRSAWAQAEWRAALAAGPARLVVLVLRPVDGAALEPELRAHLTAHTHVRWGEPRCWDKLRRALPRGPLLPRQPDDPPHHRHPDTHNTLRNNKLLNFNRLTQFFRGSHKA